MKSWSRFLHLILPLLLLTGAVQEAPSEGLSYQHMQTDDPLSMHLLVIDPDRFRIFSARAMGEGVGRETVSSIALRNGAAAAVNGGFFAIGGRYDGDPTGLLKVGKEWFSDSSLPRGAIGWTKNGRDYRIGRLTSRWWLESGARVLRVDGINRPRKPGESILYSWGFHRTTLTDPDGTEILISDGKIKEIRKGGDSSIPQDGYVYSIGPDIPAARFPSLEVGMPMEPRFNLKSQDELGVIRGWHLMDYIVGGTPVLIRKGRIISDFSQEKVKDSFVNERHPRTAVGIRANGSWVFLVVDGRQDSSRGMTLMELALKMKSLGCVDALNLDGGGSSTIFYDGKVVNSPSDFGNERPVSDAILMNPVQQTP